MKQYLFLFFIFCFSIQLNAQHNLDLKYCGADELRINTLKANPKIAEAVIQRDAQLESHTQAFVQDFYAGNVNRTATYVIPVVFHVIHNFGTENISDAQIFDGLDILNKTFRKQLADTGSIVAAFKPIHADCDIEFALAKLDPNGNCSNGINRISSSLSSLGDHSVKALIQWPTNMYLNVYIVDNAAGLAGHCVWPSDADTIPEWDGIVIGHDYVGSIGTSTYQRSVAFAHECGHYLNLHHIWGGNNVPGFYYLPCDDTSNCSSTDFVGDTPPTKGWVSCSLTGASCGNAVDNVQNTMDYSYCNRMFTIGQKARMQACLNSPIAGRDNLWQASNLLATGVSTTADLCQADFSASTNVICEGSSVTYTNTSYNGTITNVVWTFPGGTPSTSTALSPVVFYNTDGVYDATLKVYNGTDSAEITKINYISVLPASGNPYPFSDSFESTSSLNGLDWFENSLDTLNKWEITSTAAYTGTKSVMLDNFTNTISTKDELISKTIDLSGTSGISLSFKYAYAKKIATDSDKLQLYVTGNCNITWVQRLSLINPALETVSPDSVFFIPDSLSDWKHVSVTIPSSYLTSDFKFKFVFTSNTGNNIYLDDINIGLTSGTDEMNELNTSLEIFPNPATDHLNLSFHLPKAEKLAVTITDMLGKPIYHSKAENYSEGKNLITLDLQNYPAGMYFVKLNNETISVSKRFVVNGN